MMLPGRKGWEKLDCEFNNSQNKKFVFCSLPFKCVIQAPHGRCCSSCADSKENREWKSILFLLHFKPETFYMLFPLAIFFSSRHESCENLTWNLFSILNLVTGTFRVQLDFMLWSGLSTTKWAGPDRTSIDVLESWSLHNVASSKLMKNNNLICDEVKKTSWRQQSTKSEHNGKIEVDERETTIKIKKHKRRES